METTNNKTRETLGQKLLKVADKPKYKAEFGNVLDVVTIAIRVPKNSIKALKHNAEDNGSGIWYISFSQMVEKYIVANQTTLFKPIDSDYEAQIEVVEGKKSETMVMINMLDRMIARNPSMLDEETKKERFELESKLVALEVEIKAIRNRELESRQVTKAARGANLLLKSLDKLSDEDKKKLLDKFKPKEEENTQNTEENTQNTEENNDTPADDQDEFSEN
jgi:hypothetical protein